MDVLFIIVALEARDGTDERPYSDTDLTLMLLCQCTHGDNNFKNDGYE